MEHCNKQKGDARLDEDQEDMSQESRSEEPSTKNSIEIKIDNIGNIKIQTEVQNFLNKTETLYNEKSRDQDINLVKNSICISTLSCDQCGRWFPTRRKLEIHEKSVHSLFKCEVCKKEFSSKSGRNHHKKNVHGGVKFPCDQCDKQFNYKVELSRHIQSVHEGVKFYCDRCGKNFSSNCNLKNHIQSQHEKVRYSCDQCKKTFNRKYYLNIHIKSEHKGVKFKCDTCDKKFATKVNLKSHIQSAHGVTCDKQQEGSSSSIEDENEDELIIDEDSPD